MYSTNQQSVVIYDYPWRKKMEVYGDRILKRIETIYREVGRRDSGLYKNCCHLF
jgi:hypothetical protein